MADIYQKAPGIKIEVIPSFVDENYFDVVKYDNGTIELIGQTLEYYDTHQLAREWKAT